MAQINNNLEIKSAETDIDRPIRPSLVSISSNITIDTPNSDKYSTLVYDTALVKSEKNNYFYHYVKNIKYYPIRNTVIDTIDAEITDIDGQKLALKKEGQPSFLDFHLKKMKEENYYKKTNYVRIDSDKTAEKKSNADFWVHLKDAIPLKQNSRLALVDISFPNSIKNIRSTMVIDVQITNHKMIETNTAILTVTNGYYPTNESLIWTLNYNMTDELKNRLKFSQTNDYFKAECLSDHNVVIMFPTPELQNILGIQEEKTTGGKIFRREDEGLIIFLKKDQPFVASNPMDVSHYHPGVMLCHANFVEHSIVGDLFLPVLKIVPTRSASPNDYISIHFDNLEFVKPSVEYLKELHFELRDLEGKMIEFADDRKIILNFVIKT